MAIIARLRFGERVSALQPRSYLGGDVTVRAEFRDDASDALTAVAGVAFVLTKADGSIVSPAPTVLTDAAGIYRCVVTPDQAGLWAISVSASTSGATNDRREFLMVDDVTPPGVVGPTAVTAVNGRPGPTVVIGADDTAYETGETGATPRSVQDRLRDKLSAFDFAPAVWTSPDDDMPDLLAAMEAAANGDVLFPRRRSYRIASDADLTISNAVIDLNGAQIIQSTAGRGFVRIIGDRVTITGGSSPARFEFSGTRAPISGRFRGYSAFQRAVPIWVEGEYCRVEGIESTNFFNTLCLRGPVVRNPAGAGYTGADTDPTTAYLWDSRALGNYAADIVGRSQDFAITGHQQEALVIDGYLGDGITDVQGIPPHTIYMISPASGGGGALLKDCHIRNGRSRDCEHGVAHKFFYADGITFDGLSASGCAGAMLIAQSAGVRMTNLVARDLIGREGVGEDSRFALYVQDSECVIDGIHCDGRADEEVGLMLVTGASDVVLKSATMTSRFPNGSTSSAIIRTEDSAVVRIGDLFHRVSGVDAKESLFADDTSRITCGNLRTVGTALAAYAGASASVDFGYDPGENQTLDEAAMLSGTTANITYSRRDRTQEIAAQSGVSLYGTSTAGTHGYTARRIRVSRTGSFVTYAIGITVSGALSSVGDLRIGPLPYAARGATGDPAVAVVLGSWSNITVPADSILRAAILPGEDFVRLQLDTSGTRSNVTAAMCGSNLTLQFSITIQTDAA